MSGDGRMRRSWERMARGDARYFVTTRRDVAGSEAAFAASGRSDVERILRLANGGRDPASGQRYGHILEFGCGVGRMTRVLCERAGRVTAVDISPTMIERARASREWGDHVAFGTCGEGEAIPCENEAVDLVVSYLVFQHISDPSVIRWYLGETLRVLRRDSGRAVFQFDTRPSAGVIQRLYKSFPDFMLPRVHRRHIRRYRRPVGDVHSWCEAAGLEIVCEEGVGSEGYVVVLQVK